MAGRRKPETGEVTTGSGDPSTENPENVNSAGGDRRKPAVKIRAGSLLAALKDVLEVIEARSTVPVLSMVRVSVGNGVLNLMGTDTDLWATRTLATDDRDGPASKDWIESIKSFEICLPAKLLGDLLKELDGDAMVTLTAPHGDETRAVVQAGRARFKLASLAVDDFPLPPMFPGNHEFEVTCSRLADAFARVEHAVSNEATRYYLNGVYLHPFDFDLRFAATDGHRLARLSMDGPEGAASFPAVIVSTKTVAVLDKLLAAAAKTTEDKETSPASVLVTAESDRRGAMLLFELPAPDDGTIEIHAKTIDGDFPDYQRVIPTDTPHRAVIDRAPLNEAIKRVAVMSEGKSRGVKAEFSEGLLVLSARCADGSEASEELPVEYLGPPAVLGFDSRYWRESLAAIGGDHVAMAWYPTEEGNGPVRVAAWVNEDEDRLLTQVLMPMRV